MSGLTYTNSIPAPGHWPGADQGPMQTNFASIQSLIDVDHVDFSSGQNGQHKQVTIPVANVPGSPPLSTASVIYTNNGIASASGVSELYFQNSGATFLLNSIKSFGSFTTTNTLGTVSALNSFNIASISRAAGNAYNITLNSSVVTGNNIVVQITSNNSELVVSSYSFSNPVLTIVAGPQTFILNFMILQA